MPKKTMEGVVKGRGCPFGVKLADRLNGTLITRCSCAIYECMLRRAIVNRKERIAGSRRPRADQ